jgi:hypothetical protein
VAWLASSACGGTPPPSKQAVTLWRPLGSWSGRDNAQTESFTSDTGFLRITWETKRETTTGAGRFQLTVMSSISGRRLLTAVDVRGVGHNTTYVTEDPRPFFAVVQSSNVDWQFSVDEGIPATVEGKPAR